MLYLPDNAIDKCMVWATNNPTKNREKQLIFNIDSSRALSRTKRMLSVLSEITPSDDDGVFEGWEVFLFYI